MKLRIALAGELLPEPQLFGKIDLLVGQISGYLCKDNADAEIQMLVSPSYTGKVWMEWNEAHKFPVCTYNMKGSFDYVGQCAQTVRKDTSLRNVLGEALCDKADIFIIVWNEDVTELSGATWELMRIAYDRDAPCIWISTKSQQTYCLWESYYKKYTPKYLNEVSEPLQKEEIHPAAIEERKGRILSFWEKRRLNYLKGYKADIAVYPSEEDRLLRQDFEMEKEISGGEGVRKILLDKFQQYDSAAIELNSRFQAMIYQRSVLPFLATIFLAIGFYVETLIGKTLSGIVPNVATAAALLAGIGFLIHGCLNLYTYRLSKSKRIYSWQKDFAGDRYMAEVLRVLIHFQPYGVELNLRKLCAGDRKMYMTIKHLTDDTEPAEQNVDRKTVSYILQHIKEMLGDQLSYHESSANRYKAIVNSLEKWGKAGFYIGFWMVIIRGALQFVLVLFPIQERNGMDLNGIARSFLNMLALFLPAWAGYFSTKAQQNNFLYNFNNHQRMLSKLRAMRERVLYFMQQEEVPMEVFNIMADELAEIMLIEDASGWRHQYMNSTVKPL